MVITLFLACNKSTPSQPMSDSEFATAYAEYLFVVINDTAKVESRTRHLENILAEQGRTVEEFRETWKALDAKPEQWGKIMQDVTEKMQEKQTQLRQERTGKIPGSFNEEN